MPNNNIYQQNGSTAAFSFTEPDPEPDDLSDFLRQILLHSSNFMAMESSEMQCSSSLPRNQHGVESSLMLNSSFSGASIPANVSCSSVGTMDNDLDEYDCESESGTEGLAVEASGQPKPPLRNSSKRSRAAEVHNLSEKRRRSRINEKMKALQNLIPNSNKTDKASMLDEAIEYLKQLQLQVQMLTMRNGLFPLGLPRVLQQNQLSQQRMGLCEGNGFTTAKVTGTLHVNQDTSLSAIFSSSENCTETRVAPVNMSNGFQSDNAFESDSSINVHLDSFHISRSTSKGICKEDWLPVLEMNERPYKTGSLGANPESSAPFGADSSDFRRNTLESSVLPYQLGAVNESNMDCDQLLAPHLYSFIASNIGRSTSADTIKTECSNF